jgi:hypothetical protein
MSRIRLCCAWRQFRKVLDVLRTRAGQSRGANRERGLWAT